MARGTVVFDHIHLLSNNVATAANWYVEMLGGKIVTRSEVCGAPQLVVAFDGVNVIIRGQRTGETAEYQEGLTWGIDHFGFSVNQDLDVFCAELKQKGVLFTVDPKDFGPTLRIAFIESPDGVKIELLKRTI